MCGLVGIINQQSFTQNELNAIDEMMNAISHRGPDDRGVWLSENEPVILAHLRLSILDLTQSGHQPMHSACQRYVIAYNGEIYNYQELKNEFDDSAQLFQGTSDTEVLLNLFSKYGLKKALQKTVGMFAFALWDKKEKKVHLVRDRVGEKPLYYGKIGSAFVFASELAALYQHPNWKGIVNPDSLALLMRFNAIPSPHSIFSNIFKLEPGKILSYSIESQKIEFDGYWDSFEVYQKGKLQPFQGTANEATEQVEKLLSDSIAKQMIADVPIGAFLSGGIDSSTVVALMQSKSTQPIQTFSIGFWQEEFNEAVYAKKIAEYLGTNHTELYLTEKELLDVVPRIPHIYSEPFSDSSQIPTYLVSALARKSVTVSLSGDGGDELFSGYSRYDFIDDYYSKISKLPIWSRNALRVILFNLASGGSASLVKFGTKLLPKQYQFKDMNSKLLKIAEILSQQNPDEIYLQLISHWTKPHELVLNAKAVDLGEIQPNQTLSQQTFIEKMMFWDFNHYLPNDILTKVDRASMAVSLESRIPMLDHRLVEFVATLPLEYLRNNKQSKIPLRKILAQHLPPELFERPKMGFGVPIGQWLRGPLKSWAENLIQPERLKSEGYFNSELITKSWQAHQEGSKNMEYLLWDVLMFQSWLEHYSAHISKP